MLNSDPICLPLRMRLCVLLLGLLACAPFLWAQVTPAAKTPGKLVNVAGDPSRASEWAQSDEYVIAEDDVLDLYVVDVPEMSRSCRVNPDGTINLPLLTNPLPAAGLTLQQLSTSIEHALRASGMVTNAQVTVSVQQSRLHSVTIYGAVKRPQIYPVFGRTTLLDVISQAEGLADDAGGFAIIHRGTIAARILGLDPNDDAALSTRVDIRQSLDAGEQSSNVVIYPGDRIVVPKAGVVYVVGAVNRPGGYTIRPTGRGMTVMQAIALAEDVKSTAKREHAVIARVDPKSPAGRAQIPVNLKKMLAGKTPDVTLQAEDILFVPDSTGQKALRRGLESALEVATGVTIYSFAVR